MPRAGGPFQRRLILQHDSYSARILQEIHFAVWVTDREEVVLNFVIHVQTHIS